MGTEGRAGASEGQGYSTRQIELIQWRSLVSVCRSPKKVWPRWEPQSLQQASARREEPRRPTWHRSPVKKHLRARLQWGSCHATQPHRCQFSSAGHAAESERDGAVHAAAGEVGGWQGPVQVLLAPSEGLG